MSFDVSKNRPARERTRRGRAFSDAIEAGVPLDAIGHVLAMERLGAEENVVFEIGCCRLMLSRIMHVDALDARDPAALARVIGKLTGAMTNAVKLQRQIELEGGSNSSEALTALLMELGRDDA